MGAIAEAIAAFAQPLLDQTDGSADQVNRAFALAQLCWNLALLPEERRDETLGKMRTTLKMDDDEFEAFRCSVVVPMIRRHQEMFPRMHRLGLIEPSRGEPAPTTPARTEKYPGTGRNAPCPCNSGRKYKLCCGR
jgi:Ni/Co efflux regulator RcnB